MNEKTCKCNAEKCQHDPGSCKNPAANYDEPRFGGSVKAVLRSVGPICGECASCIPEERLDFLDEHGIPYL